MARTAIDIVSITTGRETLLIGPASAFGASTRSLVLRDRPRIESMLTAFVSRQGSVELIRPHLRRWGLNHAHSMHNEREWVRDTLLSSISRGVLLISVAPDVTRGFSLPHASIQQKDTSLERIAQVASQPHLPNDMEDRLALVLTMVPDYMSGATKEAFLNAIRDIGIGMIVGGLLAWIGAHFIPGINIAVLAFDVFFLSGDVLRACEQISTTLDDIRKARSQKELEPAAKIIAGALAALIVAGVLNRILRAKSITKAASKKTKHKIDEKPNLGGDKGPKREAQKPKQHADESSSAASKPAEKKPASETPPKRAKPTLDEMYAKAPAAKQEIDSIADEIAAKTNGKVAKAPLKGRDRAMEKIEKDYGGDASRIKDLARNTIVVEEHEYDNAVALLREKGATVKTIKPGDDPLGYTGTNSVVQTKAGIAAEIQVNTPEMIFAKEKPEVAKAILGEEKYNAIASRGIEGGKGHELYEKSRSMDPHDPRQAEITKESNEYYNSIRKGGK